MVSCLEPHDKNWNKLLQLHDSNVLSKTQPFSFAEAQVRPIHQSQLLIALIKPSLGNEALGILAKDPVVSMHNRWLALNAGPFRQEDFAQCNTTGGYLLLYRSGSRGKATHRFPNHCIKVMQFTRF